MLAGLIPARQGELLAGSVTQLQHEKCFTPARVVLTFRATKNNRENASMRHLRTLAIGVLIGTAAIPFSSSVFGQSDGGWITLVDSNKMGDWDEVGKANWAMKDGALVADKLNGKDASYLVSKNSYKDFQIKAEFWTDEEADRKSTRLNSSHLVISYAVFCLKKKK